jgi:hypothetical protein
MADERDTPFDEAGETAGPEEGRLEPGPRSTEVTLRPLAESPVVAWRQRAMALRSALPQLARNPVVVGASAAAATVAVRVAVDVARRAIAGSASPRPVALEVSGSILHEIRVVRHVHVVQHTVHHVVHHTSAPLAYWTLPPGPPRS